MKPELVVTVSDSAGRILRAFRSGSTVNDSDVLPSLVGDWRVVSRRELLRDGQWTLDVTVTDLASDATESGHRITATRSVLSRR